ncbi:helix-turn-helix domain-containing protein [Tsukamurella sp. NPDC003166]|uniref:helix-turn-helix domain-containing protein n=1 Tax=Tsukamurella sp. NPDC003166 TaxID=3154444 RepID=UPI0033B533AD
MGAYEDALAELGVDPDGPEVALSEDLADADATFLAGLVELRKRAGLTQQDLADAWGRHKTAVSQFEHGGNDPRLSTIRRYAASIGARYTHALWLDPVLNPDAAEPLPVRTAAWMVVTGSWQQDSHPAESGPTESKVLYGVGA